MGRWVMGRQKGGSVHYLYVALRGVMRCFADWCEVHQTLQIQLFVPLVLILYKA